MTNLARWDGQYNTQMYKFEVSEARGSVEKIEASWRGHGESHGYPTTLRIWNYNSKAWESLDSSFSLEVPIGVRLMQAQIKI